VYNSLVLTTDPSNLGLRYYAQAIVFGDGPCDLDVSNAIQTQVY
jgi:hypothetical protein